MSAGRICSRVVVTATPDESVHVAARRMKDSHVGTLVVVDPSSPKKALGVVTDRDITVRCVAEGRDAKSTPVSTVMSKPVATIDEDAPIEETIDRMARASARRLVVKDIKGGLIGIISLDDILELATSEAGALSQLLDRQSPRVTV